MAGDRVSSLSFDTLTLQPMTPVSSGLAGGGGGGRSTGAKDSDTMSPDEEDAVSNHSYTSAMSQQEDFGLINLHTQVDKPITESPLLMSSYLSHLTQLRCSNLNTAIPIFDSG